MLVGTVPSGGPEHAQVPDVDGAALRAVPPSGAVAVGTTWPDLAEMSITRLIAPARGDAVELTVVGVHRVQRAVRRRSCCTTCRPARSPPSSGFATGCAAWNALRFAIMRPAAVVADPDDAVGDARHAVRAAGAGQQRVQRWPMKATLETPLTRLPSAGLVWLEGSALTTVVTVTGRASPSRCARPAPGCWCCPCRARPRPQPARHLPTVECEPPRPPSATYRLPSGAEREPARVVESGGEDPHVDRRRAVRAGAAVSGRHAAACQRRGRRQQRDRRDHAFHDAPLVSWEVSSRPVPDRAARSPCRRRGRSRRPADLRRRHGAGSPRGCWPGRCRPFRARHRQARPGRNCGSSESRLVSAPLRG